MSIRWLDTHSTGNIGATRVDGNGNVEFHFCVIPTGYATGGVLAFYLPYLYTENMHVVKRHHDNEDHNNKNHIIDNAGFELADRKLSTLLKFYFEKSNKIV